MNGLETYKLITDVLLAFSIMFLCYRLANRPVSRAMSSEVRGLEASLRSLIEEASGASRELNQELIKRQRELEKALFDIGSAESRITKAVTSAEHMRADLQTEIGRFEAKVSEAQAINSTISAKASQSDALQNQNSYIPLEAKVERSVSMEVRAPQPASEKAQASSQAAQPARKRSLNIYGEEIEEAPSAPSAQPERSQTLKRTLAKEVEIRRPAKAPALSSKDQVQEVYNAAEEMLRAGEDLNKVAIRTALPIADVEMLSQVIEREKMLRQDQAAALEQSMPEIEVMPAEPKRKGPKDPRLGVLGGIKRQIEVL